RQRSVGVGNHVVGRRAADKDAVAAARVESDIARPTDYGIGAVGAGDGRGAAAQEKVVGATAGVEGYSFRDVTGNINGGVAAPGVGHNRAHVIVLDGAVRGPGNR